MTSSRVRRGQVQAHGALLALAEHDVAIALVSANTSEILGVAPEPLLTASIASALAAPGEKLLRELPPALGDVNPIEARTRDGRVLDAVLHRAAGMLVLELEPAGTPVRTGRINQAIDRLRGDVARAAVEELRELLGFERVALYRGPGELVTAHGEPPAFVELAPGELRFVADRAAPPVALLPALPLHAGADEVTGVVLRTVDAPGTGALLAIAVGEGGAVVCEHPIARHVPYSARAAGQVIARIAGGLLGMNDGTRIAGGALAGTRVLVIDDEPEQADTLAQLLQAAGAITEVAATAAAGMAALHRFHPDAVVSDIKLPDKDGYTLMRELRALGSDEGGWVPAIAVSGHADSDLLHQAMLAGFQVHIPKPIDPPDLVARLARLVGRTARRT
jgi:CheY-like chemotaxis protein